MKKSHAVVFVDVGKVEVQELAVAHPAPGEVQVRTLFSTISSGTEGWILANRFTWAPTRYPCVPGYQRVGIITALGEDVSGWAVGNRVVATRSAAVAPLGAQSGAHMGLANTPVDELYRVPAAVENLDASAAVVAQVGYNAASRVRLASGDWTVVYGDGLIGQCAAQALRARGARVILVGHRPARLQLATAAGVDLALNSHDGDLVATVRRRVGSQTITAVLDAVQTPQVQREYMPLLERAGGQIVYCGFTPGTAWADMGLLQQRELTVHFISGWTRPRMEETLALMARESLRPHSLITHRVPYTRAPQMYALIAHKTEPFLGIALDWTGS